MPYQIIRVHITDTGSGTDGAIEAAYLELEHKVAAAIEDGWQPFGGVNALQRQRPHGLAIWFTQAVAKEPRSVLRIPAGNMTEEEIDNLEEIRRGDRVRLLADGEEGRPAPKPEDLYDYFIDNVAKPAADKGEAPKGEADKGEEKPPTPPAVRKDAGKPQGNGKAKPT